MKENRPPVNELVGFLDRYAPAELRTLRAQYPLAADTLLCVGLHAGGECSPMLPVADEEQVWREVAAKACLAAMAEIAPALDDCIHHLLDRVRRARKAGLLAQLASAIGGAAVIGTLSLDLRVGTYLSGSLSLVGAIAALIRDHNGKIAVLVAVHKRLAGLRRQARDIERKVYLLTAAAGAPSAIGDQLAALIQDGNRLCADAVDAMSEALDVGAVALETQANVSGREPPKAAIETTHALKQKQGSR